MACNFILWFLVTKHYARAEFTYEFKSSSSTLVSGLCTLSALVLSGRLVYMSLLISFVREMWELGALVYDCCVVDH